MSIIRTKRGDTLAFVLFLQDISGAPATGLLPNIRSQVRRATDDTLMGTFEITEPSEPGHYQFYMPASVTSSWDEDVYLFDVEYTIGNVVQSTETYRIRVGKDVTKDE